MSDFKCEEKSGWFSLLNFAIFFKRKIFFVFTPKASSSMPTSARILTAPKAKYSAEESAKQAGSSAQIDTPFLIPRLARSYLPRMVISPR